MMYFTPKKGYTLIELIVSVALFSLVMLTATAAYLSFINYNRRASQVASLMNSLSFAVDAMARDIRTGTRYACQGGNCSSNGESTFLFTDANGCAVTYSYSSGALYKSTSNTASGCETRNGRMMIGPDVTPGVTLNNVSFYVRGTSSADAYQPIATIVLRGSTEIVDTGELIPFSIETSATSRVPDIGN